MQAMWTLACATCASNFQGEGGDAAGWSILFLLAVIVPLMAGVAFFMVRMARREAAALDPELRGD